jgi:dTDP-4-amino-4,6-dideoxygalactose transaminase
MHTFGFMCKIDEIIEICNKWKIPVVEDAAEALGSFYKGKSAGSFGVASAFSFNGNKIITSGGGGIITTNNEDIGIKAKYLTTTAKVPHAWEYVHDEFGYNYRMPNLNAALACAQLEQLTVIKESKKKLYNEYQTFFSTQGIQLVDIPRDTDWNYWLTSVLLENKKDRDLFLKETNGSKVMTRPIWQLMYRLPMYNECQKDSQLNAEFLEERIINIPSSVRIK